MTREAAVLRLGHRPERDQRVTTHVGLTARALGARRLYLAANDTGVVRSVEDVVERWGGDFEAENDVRWRRCIADWKASGGAVVHLTMYGLNLPDVIHEVRARDRVLVVVGAEKVPGEVYDLADFNIAVTNQPHSEIAGLAVFLDWLFEGRELGATFPGARIRVIPSAHGKLAEGPAGEMYGAYRLAELIRRGVELSTLDLTARPRVPVRSISTDYGGVEHWRKLIEAAPSR
jgi:tRNA (cytidine56-2'-O)-methyltransferase